MPARARQSAMLLLTLLLAVASLRVAAPADCAVDDCAAPCCARDAGQTTLVPILPCCRTTMLSAAAAQPTPAVDDTAPARALALLDERPRLLPPAALAATDDG